MMYCLCKVFRRQGYERNNEKVIGTGFKFVLAKRVLEFKLGSFEGRSVILVGVTEVELVTGI